MKKRLIAFLLVICLCAGFIFTAGAAEPTLEDSVDMDLLVSHATSVCRYLEAGNRDNSVVNTSMGCVGMGYLGWVGSSALQLLKWCASPEKGGDPAYCREVLGEALYNEVVSAPVAIPSTLMPAWTYWRYREFTDEELAAARTLLGSELGIRTQYALARCCIQIYAQHGWKAGVRTEPALVYYCSAENHYGEAGVQNFMHAVKAALGLNDDDLILSLDQFYQGTVAGAAAGTISTLPYRRMVYEYLTQTLHLYSGPDVPPADPSEPSEPAEPTEPSTPVEINSSGTPFTDLPDPDHWAYDAIVWSYNHTPQITAGTTSTTFSPDDNLSRAEAMTFLWAAAGRPAPESESNRFTDVKRKSWYRTPVLWAVENGYTDGTTPTTFSPRSSVTRGEMLTFLYALAGHPDFEVTENPFTDVSARKYYYKPAIWAYNNNILVGNEGDNGALRPNKTCTRAYVVTYIYRYFTNETD